MSAIPGGIDEQRAPPMAVPLRHFLVGLGFLAVGPLVGTAIGLGAVSGGRLAHVHLLLAGWVCVTIMGAMTQFVPVWSGVELHSRLLATAQLWIVSVGLLAFVTGLLSGTTELLAVGGGGMLLGFWVFVYNIARTLASARPWDVTERHFAVALGFFLALTVLGFSLALDYTYPVFAELPIGRDSVRMAHVTLAIFGAVLTTVIGALYQLATMFTQTDPSGIDVPIQRFETVGYPLGVVALAVGRLFEAALIARLGGILVASSVLGVSIVLFRRLHEARVPQTPMLRRYAVVAAALALWAVLTLRSWVRDPLASGSIYGAPGTVHLLAFGAIGFVVLGTLYHVVPFIVWVHRYSDRLGLADVPMIDDIYDGRLAKADLLALSAGTAGLVAADLLDTPDLVTFVSGGLILLGSGLFIYNMLLTLHRHSPGGIAGVLIGERRAERLKRGGARSQGRETEHDRKNAEPTGRESNR